jgi:alpha-L-fucosidase
VPGPSEWIQHNAQIPVEQYEPIAARFDPMDFDAREWARLAREAGMRYVVITSKHHDGFCMWDSALTDWDIRATPFGRRGRDPLEELAEACRDEGLRFGLYHSILDWHHPDYLPRRPWDTRPADDADFERYVEHMKAQLVELLQPRYGPPDILWFDGEWEQSWTHEQGQRLYGFVRLLQPEILVNNRVDKGRAGMAGLTRAGGFAGDFGTPEQELPARGMPGVDWESCLTMNHSWGFKLDDNDWKSTTGLVRTLVECASKGGNLLLNVGPRPDGTIPMASVERLRAMGAWLEVYGESIYRTSGTPFDRLPHPCTSAPDRLYVHLLDWPVTRRVVLPGLRNEATGAWLMGDRRRQRLPVSREGDAVIVRLPERRESLLGEEDAELHDHDTVLVVEVEGLPVAEPLPLRQMPNGRVELTALDADVHGSTPRYERDKQCLGYWTDEGDWLSWTFELERPGEYDLVVEWACDPGSAGAAFRVDVAGQAFDGAVLDTGGWSRFVRRGLGAVVFEEAGTHTVTLRPTAKPGPAVMNLRGLSLEPVD